MDFIKKLPPFDRKSECLNVIIDTPKGSRNKSKLLEEIEHFFISYNTIKGKKFKPRGRFGPDRARKLVNRSSR